MRLLGRPPLGAALLAAARRTTDAPRSTGSSPTSPRSAPAEAVSSSRRMSSAGSVSTNSTSCLLTLARDAGGDVHQAMGVGGDEVERTLAAATGQRASSVAVSARSARAPLDRSPPAARHARVAGVGAAEHAHAERQVLLADQRAAARRSAAPDSRAAASPRRCHRAAGRRCRRPGPRRARRPRRRRRSADLVPLDLVGDQRRHEVVDVRRAGQQHRERSRRRRRTSAAGGPGPRPRASRSTSRPPAISASADWPMTTCRAPAIAVGQAADRVQEGAEVELLAVGQRVQARAHRPVGRLEHAQPRLTAGPQQRRVGALVELDLVGKAVSPVSVRLVMERRATATPCLFLHVGDAGSRGRPRAPDQPATAIRVITYGSAWKSVASVARTSRSRYGRPSRIRTAAPRPGAPARLPLAEDHRRERDEAAPVGHVEVERAVEADRQVDAAERREHARGDDRRVAGGDHLETDRGCRAGLFTDRRAGAGPRRSGTGTTR